jgi:hypothetical protein
VNTEAFIANMDGILKGLIIKRFSQGHPKTGHALSLGHMTSDFKGQRRPKVDVPNRILGILPAVETCIMFAPSKSLFDFV